jgi:hypothetical protein
VNGLRWILTPLLCLLATAPHGAVLPVSAQSIESPVSALERLVGGRWYIGDDSYHVFSWGVGRQSVIGEAYFLMPGGETLVSQTTFFYHPGRETLVAFGVAVEMGIDVFEYTSIEARGDTLVLELTAYGSQAPEGTQRETWTFTDDDHYEWVLWARNEEGAWTRSMGGTFERR